MIDKLLMAAATAIFCATPTVAAVLTVPYPAAQAQELVLKALADQHPGKPDRRRYRMATPYGAPLFPPDSYFNDQPGNGQLARWRALATDQRRYDVLISPDVDFYWTADGKAFACEFIVHVEQGGAGQAQLTILQAHPVVYLGRKFWALGRTGPGWYRELKPAPPSPQATAELRTYLMTILGENYGALPH